MDAQKTAAPAHYACVEPRNYHSGLPACPRHLSRQDTPYGQFRKALAMVPGHVALVTPDGTLTFAELEELIRRYATALLALGVRPGEAVALNVGNRWEQLPIWLAVARIGAVFMATSRYLTRDEIAFQLSEARPRLVIGDLGAPLADVLIAATDDAAEPFANENAIFAIRFSSGTTGKPKMMVASHRCQAFIYPIYAREMALTERDVHLCVGPLAHAAIHFALSQLFVGGKVVMKEQFDKERFWEECRTHGVTNSMVVPTMITSALDHPGDAPTLRALTSLGASLAPPLKRRLLERFPRLGLYEMYGASELGTVTCLRPDEQLERPASVGRACLGSEVAIFDDAGAPVPSGQTGTIYSRSISVIDGIVGSVRPPDFPERLKAQGWWSCGDLGWFDEDGYLFISDRRADLILSGGLNVYPAEIEALLLEVPGIRNAVVVGLPDEKWGQRVTAYLEGEAPEDTLSNTCKEKLASYKQPRAFHFVEALPRTSSGKVSRNLVREAVGQGRLPG